ncbi:11660_t:CDS:2 [Dentiscutata heterogama]|uniref:11660_t:CDS:1 n=1 Tax=Dentiscutata heterogama TaxID=1316150 RepID=A0ACA9MPZ4_9GLOM|nr:11660_t:CDS:2 [Dentiscutata heterogama]
MSKNNYEYKQSKITLFISIAQTSKKSNLLYDENNLFSEDFDFNNFENSTDEGSNNEQDTSELKKPEYNHSEQNIVPGSTNLLSLPEPIAATQSIRSEYGSYTNNQAGKQFIKAIACIIKLQSASSNVIFKDLNQFILAKYLPLESLYHFGSDGASVNLGHVNGIATQLKTRLLFLTEHHCINYRLALASKDAAEQTPYFEVYDKTVRQLYNESNLDILQVIKTRWLSLSNVVNNLYQIINSVISALLEDVSKADILSQLRRLSLVFQADYASVSEVTIQVDAIIESITIDFIDLPLFVREFTINTVKNIKLRFPDRVLINSFKIFDPKQLPTDRYLISIYGNSEIIKIGNFYGTSKKTTDNLAQEWRIIRSLLFNYRNLHITKAWHSILQENQDFALIYPNIYFIISIVLCLPLSNAYVERVFSKQNLIKTKLRNRMLSDTLNDILMISLNGPAYNEFNYEHAYQFWRSSLFH